MFTESGRKVRHVVTHPDELAETVEDVRSYIESQAKMVSGQVRNVLDRAKLGWDEGHRAYGETGLNHESRLRHLEGKNNEIASSVHKTVDNMSRTAYTVEESVLDPIFELVAIYRGFERGIRAVLGGKTKAHVSSFYKS
jgi:hypothetical protein